MEVLSEATRSNRILSIKGHMLARQQVYPLLFGSSDITYEYFGYLELTADPRAIHYDAEQGIDLLVSVRCGGMNYPFTVQERFRRMRFVEYDDVTVTEWLCSTVMADFLVYGVLDTDDPIENPPQKILKSVVLDMSKVRLELLKGNLPFKRKINSRDGIPFLVLSIEDLLGQGCVLLIRKETEEDTV